LDLEQSADLIVVGAASGTVQAGSAASFSLQVSRVVKGDPSLASGVIAVNWPGGAPGAAPTGSGLWFLQRSSAAWLVLPVVRGSVPSSMTFFPAPAGPILSAYAYGPAASLSDKIASEISSVIEGANGAYNPQLYALQYGLLDQLQSPVLAVLYQRMSASVLAQQRILGLSGLIRGGSAAALVSAVQAASQFGNYPMEDSVLLLSIREHFRTTDASSVAVLGQAAVDATNSSLAFREAAAHALAAIHTAPALPYLAALLDDPDFNLRVEAIGGMGAFANGLPTQIAEGVPSLAHLQVPASAPYRTAGTIANLAMGSSAIGRNEVSLLSFWKGWWLQNRTDLIY
jgi:hypothetical protein